MRKGLWAFSSWLAFRMPISSAGKLQLHGKWWKWHKKITIPSHDEVMSHIWVTVIQWGFKSRVKFEMLRVQPEALKILTRILTPRWFLWQMYQTSSTTHYLLCVCFVQTIKSGRVLDISAGKSWGWRLILKFHALSSRLEGFTCAFIVAFLDLIRRIYVEKKNEKKHDLEFWTVIKHPLLWKS